MEIFRHARHQTSVAQEWAACAAARQRQDGLGLLLAAARLECGLSDLELAREGRDGGDDGGRDGDDVGRQRALAWSQAAAELYLAGHTRRPLPGGPGPWGRDPQVLHYHDPEGLRYYGLSLDGYAAAARGWQSGHRHERAWVLGLRSMGSVLAPLVWAALQPGRHRCTTLRPQGDPQRRHLALTPRLRQRLQAWPGAFLIVDEGPGLSGSSFAGAVALLQGLGVNLDRVALLPSWDVDAAAAQRLNSPLASRHWMSWSCYPALPLRAPAAAAAVVLHGGRWRQRLRRGTAAPVWSTHERLKYLTEGGRTVTKFAGLGPYGIATWERARRLAAAGWGPEVVSGAAEAAAGWVVYRRVRARPLPARPGRAWAEWAGSYLASLQTEFRLGDAAMPAPELVAMLRINLERLGWPWTPPPLPEAPPVALDARLQRWEWGLSRGRWIKFDATDHGDDPFYPGPTDIAWDLAGLAVEFGPALGAAARAAFCRCSGATEPALRPRLAWHGLAYCAFQAAYCTFAAGQVTAAEADRFRRQRRRYWAAAARLAG